MLLDVRRCAASALHARRWLTRFAAQTERGAAGDMLNDLLVAATNVHVLTADLLCVIKVRGALCARMRVRATFRWAQLRDNTLVANPQATKMVEFLSVRVCARPGAEPLSETAIRSHSRSVWSRARRATLT